MDETQVEELVAWVRSVLTDQRRVALLPLVSGSPGPSGVREEAQRRTLVRIDAELETVDLAESYLSPASEPVAQGLAEKLVTWLAYGHRYDRPGWLPEWTPAAAARAS